MRACLRACMRAWVGAPRSHKCGSARAPARAQLCINTTVLPSSSPHASTSRKICVQVAHALEPAHPRAGSAAERARPPPHS
eukprot:6172020-Pleurochrysis_carterae.AAC.5